MIVVDMPNLDDDKIPISKSERVTKNDDGKQTSASSDGQQQEIGTLLRHQRGLNDKIRDGNYNPILKQLQLEGRRLRSDYLGAQPSFSDKPEWLDEKLIENAKLVYANHFMAINFAHLTGLLLLVRVDSIHRTLKATGESLNCAKLFKRYYHTLTHVKKWYEGDILTSGDPAQRSLQIVRGMHNKVSTKFNDHNNNNNNKCEAQESSQTCQAIGSEDESQCPLANNDLGQFRHISQYDLMITQFAFVGFIVTHPQKVGLLDKFSRYDLESILHFWRVIGHYLGATGAYNLCSYELDDIIGLCKAMNELEYKASLSARDLQSEHGLMSLNISRALKFIPLITFYGMMKHAYGMLGQDKTEIEERKTIYSCISYYFIDLVMCRFLAYGPLRLFNNGLIRFSIYMVGRYENWFMHHLESSYGLELRP